MRTQELATLGKQYDVRSIANWILDRAKTLGMPTPTNMAINKLVYFLFEQMLLEKRRKIFTAKIEAWEHGPVIRELYSEFKVSSDGPITGRARKFSLATRQMEVAHDELSAEDEKQFAEIIDHYLPMTAATLRRISHQCDGPWFNVWSHEGMSLPGMEITSDIIDKSFNNYKVSG
jgi:uncharacterized phage-associated protein